MEALGINFGHVIIYTLLLAFLLNLVKKKLIPKLDEVLQQRQAEIERGITAGKNAQTTEEQAVTTSQKMLADAKKQRQALLDQYRSEAEKSAKEIIDIATKKAQAIISAAEQRRDTDYQTAKSQALAEISLLVESGKIKISK